VLSFEMGGFLADGQSAVEFGGALFHEASNQLKNPGSDSR
jgi:hypothetical protein